MTHSDQKTKQDSRWLKWPLMLVLALAGCLVIALIAPGFIDWTPYRARFETVASDMLQRPVTISGPLSFSFLPTPSFSAESVTIDTLPEGQAPFLARIDRLDMELALGPLLRGDIEVRRFELVRPLVNPERLPDGRVTWLLGDSTRTPSGSRAIRFDNIVIKDGTLLIQDGTTNRNWRFEAIDARVKAGSLSGPYRLEGSARLDGLPLSLTLRTDKIEAGYRAPLSVRFDMGEGALAAMGWVQPLADEKIPDFSLTVEVDSPKLGLFIENAVRLSGSKDQALPDFVPWLDGPMSLKVALSGSGQAITLSDLKGRYDGSPLKADGTLDFSDGPKATLALEIDRLALPAFARAGPYPEGSSPAAEPFALPAYPVLPDGGSLDLAVKVGAISYGAGVASDLIIKTQITSANARLETFEVNLPGVSRLSFTGEVMNSGEGGAELKGHLDASSSSLRTVFDWLDIPHSVPEGRLSSLQLSTDIVVGPDRFSASALDVVLDGSQVTGSLTLLKRGEKPALMADLAVDRLDLDSYLRPRDPALPPFTIEDMAKALNDGLGTLGNMDRDLQLSIGRMRFMQHRLDRLSIALSHNGEGLVIEALEIGSLDGLALTASGRLDHGERLPGFDLMFQGRTSNLSRFASMADIALPSFMTAEDAAIGEVTLEGKLSGDFSDMSLDLVGNIAEGRMTVRGNLNSAVSDAGQKKPEAHVDLALTFNHASQRVLGQKLGMPWLTQGQALPIGLSVTAAGPLSDMELLGNLTIFGGRLALSGGMDGWLDAPVLSLALDASHPSLARLLQQVVPDYRLAAGDPGALKGRLDLGYEASVFSIDQLDLAIGKTAVEGDARIDFSAKRPNLTAALSSHGPSLFNMFKRESPKITAGKVDDEASSRWSHKAMDLSALSMLEGRLHLMMEDATFDGVIMTNLDVTAHLEDGTLTLDRVDGRVFDGKLQLNGTLTGTDVPTLALDFSLTDVSLGDVMDAGLGARAADGRANIVGTLSARGRSPYVLVAGLDGDMRLDARDGTLKGFDFGALARGVKEVKRPSDTALLVGAFASGDHSVFQKLSADIHVEKAAFISENLKADMGDGSLSGRFRADIADWSLTAKGSLTLADHPKAPPVNIDLGGNLSRPVMALDTGPLRRWLLARAVNNLPIRLSTPETSALGVPEVVGSDTDDSPKKGPTY